MHAEICIIFASVDSVCFRVKAQTFRLTNLQFYKPA